MFQVPPEVSADPTLPIAVQDVSLHMGLAQAPEYSRHKPLSTGRAALKMEL